MAIKAQSLSVNLITPNGGETFQAGQQVNIQWQSTGASSQVVKLSTDGGVSYDDISAQLTGTTQSFLWTVPAQITGQARIRVAVRDAGGNRATDDSDNNFTISQAPAPSINSINPVSGPLSGGTAVTLAGQNFADGCKVKFGGVDAQITSNNSTQIIATTPPQTSAGPVNVKVVNPDQQSDVRQNAFQYTEPQPVTIQVTAPVGGAFQAGQQITVQWTASGGSAAFFAIRLSLDNGSTFSNITSDDLPAGARSYSFTLPDPSAASAQAVIRVAAKDASHNQIAKGDSQPFTLQKATVVTVTAPAGGEFQTGQPLTVQWQVSGPVSFQAVRISYNGGDFVNLTANDLDGNTRSFTFNLPDPQTASAQAVIRVAAKDATRTQIAKGDSALLTVKRAPAATDVKVTSPSGGTYQAGQSIDVEWTTTGPVSSHAVRISFDGINFTNVTTGDLPGTAKSFTFNLPIPPSQSVTATIRVAAKDASGSQIAKGDSAPFTLQKPSTSVTVTAPNGGTFQAGQQITAQWSTGGPVSFHAVRIAFGNSQDFINVTSDDLPADARSYTFALPTPPSAPTQAVIRVAAKDAARTQIAKGDSAPFTVQQASTQTSVSVADLTGSPFQPGQQVTVKWQVAGPVSFQAVRLSYNGGAFMDQTQADLDGSVRSLTFPLPEPPTQPAQAVISVVAKNASRAEVARGQCSSFAVQRAQTGDLTVTSITPNEGATTGGLNVTVKGDRFAQGANLFLGGIAAQDVRVVDAQTITAKTPARNTAGSVNVKVQNPDMKEATLPKGFKYNDAPVITEIAPDNAPINTDGTIVVIRGLFFQQGIKVFFKDTQAEIRSLDITEGRIEVVVPKSSVAGAVRVKVLNPDEGEARKPDGFSYLGPNQQKRARIRKVTPTAILEGDTPLIKVYGNNLHEARKTGTFAVRTTNALKVVWTNIELKNDDDTGEEYVQFNLQVSTASGQPLGALQRGIVEIIADRRPKAIKDGLAAAFAFITVLPRALPVAISFTASVTKGKTSVVAVAGKNLKDTVLTMGEQEGVSLDHQYSDDNLAVALVSVDDSASPNTNLAINLVDSSTRSSVIAPLSVQVREAKASSAVSKLANTLDGDSDVDVGGFSTLPGQVALGPTETDSIAYNLSLTPGTPPTFSGVPDPKHADLVVGAEFTLLDLALNIPLFTYGRVLTLFDKGGRDISADRKLFFRLGKTGDVRVLTLFLALDIQLIIELRLTVFLGINPFPDFDSPDPFLGAFAGNPSLPARAFGVVVVGFQAHFGIGVSVALFAGLIAPLNPSTPDLVFKQLAAFLFDVSFDSQSKTLKLNGKFIFTIQGKISFSPLKFDNCLQLLSDRVQPDKLALGFTATYLATNVGDCCDTFHYGDEAGGGFALGFASTGGDDFNVLPLIPDVPVCVKVKPAKVVSIIFELLDDEGLYVALEPNQTVRVGVPGFSKNPDVLKKRFRMLRAKVDPKPELDSVQVISDERLGVTETRAPEFGFILLKVAGLFNKDENYPQEPVPLKAKHSPSGKEVDLKIAIAVPSKIKQPFDTRSGPASFTNKDAPQKDSLNFALNNETFPIDPSVLPPIFNLKTLYMHLLTITVLDQFNMPVGDLYAGSPIEEQFINKPDTFFPLNTVLSPESTYGDPVGRFEPATPQQAEKGTDAYNKWLAQKGPGAPLEEIPEVVQNLRVFVDRFELKPSPAINNRRVTSQPPNIVNITYGPAGLTVPLAPSMLTAEVNKPGEKPQVKLSWQDNSDNEEVFVIFVALPPDPPVLSELGRVTKNVTSFIDEGVHSGCIYTYQIRAENSAGASNLSDPAKVMLPLANPFSLAATMEGSGVRLVWQYERFACFDGFNVERKQGDGAWILIHQTILVDGLTYKDDTVVAGKKYTYRVQAFAKGLKDPVVKSEYSNEASPRPAAPLSITGISPGTGLAGATVTVTGTGFSGVTALKVGATSINTFTVSPDGSSITFAVPQGLQGGAVSVTTKNGTATGPSFMLAEVKLSVSPNTQGITAGESAAFAISINRSNFSGALELSVGGLPAGATAAFNPNPATGGSASLAINTTPATPAGNSNLTINAKASGNSIAQASVSLAVKAPAPALPTIRGFSPPSGRAGDAITITGANFTAVTSVKFNATNAAFFVNSPTAITATVPQRATTGPISVATGGGEGQSSQSFIVIPQKGKESKEGKEAKERKEGKESKEGKEGKDKDGKEVKEGKEDKEKERKERKEIKERKEGKEDFEGLFGGSFPGEQKAKPLTEDDGAETVAENGRAFISPEKRPAVGEAIMRKEKKERA